MLLLRHQLHPNELDAHFVQQELRSEDLVICRAKFSGGMFEEVPNLATGRRAHWSKVRIVLAGHVLAHTRAGGTILGPGDMVVSRGWDDHRCRALDLHTDYLLVAWKHGSLAGDLPPASMGGPSSCECGAGASASPAARAFELARALEAGSWQSGAAATALLQALARCGLPLAGDAIEAAGARIDAGQHELARAFCATLFPLATRPMAQDLGAALGLGDRHALRRANAFLNRFYVTATGWRQFVHGMRLELGVFLATNPRATTESVSRALGFGSPTTLCHAFHDIGLPSPQEVRRRMRVA